MQTKFACRQIMAALDELPSVAYFKNYTTTVTKYGRLGKRVFEQHIQSYACRLKMEHKVIVSQTNYWLKLMLNNKWNNMCFDVIRKVSSLKYFGSRYRFQMKLYTQSLSPLLFDLPQSYIDDSAHRRFTFLPLAEQTLYYFPLSFYHSFHVCFSPEFALHTQKKKEERCSLSTSRNDWQLMVRTRKHNKFGCLSRFVFGLAQL